MRHKQDKVDTQGKTNVSMKNYIRPFSMHKENKHLDLRITHRPSYPPWASNIPRVERVSGIHRELYTQYINIGRQPPLGSVLFVVTFEPQPSCIADAVVEKENKVEPTADNKAHQGETQQFQDYVHGRICDRVKFTHYTVIILERVQRIFSERRKQFNISRVLHVLRIRLTLRYVLLDALLHMEKFHIQKTRQTHFARQSCMYIGHTLPIGKGEL